MRRGLSLVNWHCMCRRQGETAAHLLNRCDIAYALWGDVFQMFGIHWVMPRNVASLLFRRRNWFGKRGSDMWNMVLACSEGAK